MDEHYFPSKKEVEKHWQAQEPSVFRPPYSRDKGLSIVNSAAEVLGVLEMEAKGNPVQLYKMRSPATTYPDIIAEAQELFRSYHQLGLTADEFKPKIKGPIEHLAFLILYGDMSDNQRANNLVKLAKLLNDEAKATADRAHRERDIELKKERNMLRGISLAEQVKANEEKRQRLAAQQAAKEPDAE